MQLLTQTLLHAVLEGGGGCGLPCKWQVHGGCFGQLQQERQRQRLTHWARQMNADRPAPCAAHARESVPAFATCICICAVLQLQTQLPMLMLLLQRCGHFGNVAAPKPTALRCALIKISFLLLLLCIALRSPSRSLSLLRPSSVGQKQMQLVAL